MTPFVRASWPPEYFDFHRYMAVGMSKAAAKSFVRRLQTDPVYVNDTYQVVMRVYDSGELRHLSIKRLDREIIHDWRDLQTIKNELCGDECEAVELYPAESRRVDTANQYHLWVFRKDYRVPFGFTERTVWEPGEGPQLPNVRQRPLAEARCVVPS